MKEKRGHSFILNKFILMILADIVRHSSLLALDLETSGSSALLIHLDSYHQLSNYKCDETLWRTDRCDPYFIISVRTVASRLLGSFESLPFDDAPQRLQFGSSVRQLPNPMAFYFTDSDGLGEASAVLNIEITVKDHDPHTQDELMDTFHWSLPVADASPNASAAVLNSRQRGDKLSLSARIVCRPGRFGPGCSVACRPRGAPDGSGGGFGCDLATGGRVCLPGYLDPGTGCLRRDFCAPGPVAVCANGGTCENTDAGARCNCREGFLGPACRTPARPCAPEAEGRGLGCARGVCVLRDGKRGTEPDCVCEDGFQGERCETDINECLDSPCLNGASCVNSIGSFLCQCQSGFSGRRCQLPPMLLPPTEASTAGGDPRHMASSSNDASHLKGSHLILTAVVASTVTVLVLVLIALSFVFLRRRYLRSRAGKSTPAPAAVVTFSRGGGAGGYQEGCYYESVDPPDADADDLNPYEIDEAEEAGDCEQNFPNAAYSMAETLPLRVVPAAPSPPPPSPPPRGGGGGGLNGPVREGEAQWDLYADLPVSNV